MTNPINLKSYTLSLSVSLSLSVCLSLYLSLSLSLSFSLCRSDSLRHCFYMMHYSPSGELIYDDFTVHPYNHEEMGSL